MQRQGGLHVPQQDPQQTAVQRKDWADEELEDEDDEPTEMAVDASKAGGSPDKAAGSSKTKASSDEILVAMGLATGKEARPAGSVVA